MTTRLNMTLPYPPSGNHMWKHTRQGKHYLTDRARSYYADVGMATYHQQAVIGIDQPIQVQCVLYPPDKRRRDMDNAWKVISDALTKAGVWEDDHFIRKLTLEWQTPVKGGKVFVSIALRDEIVVTS